MKTVELRLPSDPEFVTTLRLVTASCARIVGFDVEAVDDLRVSVSEAANSLIERKEPICADFSMDENQMTITIPSVFTDQESRTQKLRRLILESLMDEVDYTDGAVHLVKNRT